MFIIKKGGVFIIAKAIKNGTDRADKIIVTEESLVTAGKGNDTITVSKGNKSVIRGGDGNDTFTINATLGILNQVYGNADNDTFKIKGGDKNLYNGGDGNDTITLSGGYKNGILGGIGDDKITITGKESKVISRFSVEETRIL